MTDQQVFDNETTNFVDGYCKIYSNCIESDIERHCVGRNTSLLWTNNPNGQDAPQEPSALIEAIIARFTESLAYTHENVCNRATSDITSMSPRLYSKSTFTMIHYYYSITLTAQLLSIRITKEKAMRSSRTRAQA